jgi:hypothetical protein
VSRQRIDALNRAGRLVWDNGWIDIAATRSRLSPANLRPHTPGRKRKHYLEKKNPCKVYATPNDVAKIKRIIKPKR